MSSSLVLSYLVEVGLLLDEWVKDLDINIEKGRAGDLLAKTVRETQHSSLSRFIVLDFCHGVAD